MENEAARGAASVPLHGAEAPAGSRGDGGESRAARARLLIVDVDATLFELLQEWLDAREFCISREGVEGDVMRQNVDLILVDVAFPRQSGVAVLQRLAAERPGTPVLALSSAFFAGTASAGMVARSLGVAAVLPKPFSRDALLAAVKQTLSGPA